MNKWLLLSVAAAIILSITIALPCQAVACQFGCISSAEAYDPDIVTTTAIDLSYCHSIVALHASMRPSNARHEFRLHHLFGHTIILRR